MQRLFSFPLSQNVEARELQAFPVHTFAWFNRFGAPFAHERIAA